ncbi:MAG: hypothetical protein OHK0022_38240 [Roseiflexaceae bacterium]
MVRTQRLLAVLALVGLLALFGGGAAAQGRGKPDKPGKPDTPAKAATITWSTPQVVQQVAAGGGTTLELSFTSSADLERVTLRVPGALGRLLKVEPAGWDKIAANTPVTVRLTFSTPAKGNRAAQGGVVQVRAGQRTVGRPLPVRAVFRTGDDTRASLSKTWPLALGSPEQRNH